MGCDPRAIYDHREKYPSFEQAFSLARAHGLELLADDLITLDQDVSDVLRARLRSENLRWLLSRRLPHQYGDRLAVDMTGQIDLRAALTAANSRIALQAPVTYDVLPAPRQQDALPMLAPELAKLLD